MRNLPYAIRNLYLVAERHKVTIPAEIRRELDKPLAIIDRAESTTFKGPTVGEAVSAAFMANRDPVTDTAVHEALVRSKLNSALALNQIAETAANTLYDSGRKHIDKIIEAFKPAFNKAGEEFTTAVKQLAAAGITKPDSTGSNNLELARINIRAQEAAKTLNEIGASTNSLLVALDRLNGTPLGTKVNQLDTAETTAAEIIRTLPTGSTHWQAVIAGYTLSLATPTETDDRAARAYDAQQKAEEEQKARSRRSY